MRLYEPLRRLPTNTAIFRVVLIEPALIRFREARDAGDAAEVDAAAAEVDAAEVEKIAVTLTEALSQSFRDRASSLGRKPMHD
jgi:hypothetical protein